MTENDPIHQLIRLKRHEQPPVDFVEDFLATFHQRQRAELLQRSARGILWERVTTYFEDLMTPKWGWAFASVMAIASLGYMLRPVEPSSHEVAGNTGAHNAPAVAQTNVPAADERYLISGHYKGGLADDLNSRPHSNSALQPDDRNSRVNGNMLPAGLRISDDVMSH